MTFYNSAFYVLSFITFAVQAASAFSLIHRHKAGCVFLRLRWEKAGRLAGSPNQRRVCRTRLSLCPKHFPRLSWSVGKKKRTLQRGASPLRTIGLSLRSWLRGKPASHGWGFYVAFFAFALPSGLECFRWSDYVYGDFKPPTHQTTRKLRTILSGVLQSLKLQGYIDRVSAISTLFENLRTIVWKKN